MKTDTPICPFCGAKHSHDRAFARCKKCLLPDEVKAAGPEAIAAWDKQTQENKRLFGRTQARRQHAERGKPSKRRAKAGPETWMHRAKAKHKKERQHA